MQFTSCLDRRDCRQKKDGTKTHTPGILSDRTLDRNGEPGGVMHDEIVHRVVSGLRARLCL